MGLRHPSEPGSGASLRAGTARFVRAVRAHRLALFATTLVLCALCFQMIPGNTLASSVAQSVVLAAVAMIAVALGHRTALCLPVVGAASHGCGTDAGSNAVGEWSENTCRSAPNARGGRDRARWGGLGRWTVAVLAIGALAGATSWWAAGGAGAVGDAVSGGAGVAPGLTFRVAAVALLCLFTGVFEEGVFRVLALDAFALAFGAGRRNGFDATVSGSIAFKSAGPWPRGMLKAAIASSALFGILHVSAADAAAAGSAVAWAQFALKPVQAGLFGFFMAALFMRTGSLWTVAGVHGLFNLMYTGPVLVTGGLSSTYVTGSPADLALLATTVLLLIPPALAAAHTFGNPREGSCGPP
ncbi:CPBP family intramembrane glutamic endopeptidase [Enteroscipio rubneri]|uniref:CPBP family intramembrane glutamic endopeptidase n=1 Tax=Enteroscipio rubneri TaxID=2070686 RepID=UPI00320A1E1C